MIIDPSISDKAISLNNWLEQLTESKDDQAVIIQTNRFTYSITQAKAGIVNKSWDISELQDNQPARVRASEGSDIFRRIYPNVPVPRKLQPLWP